MNIETLLDKARQGDEQALEELLGLLEKEEPPKEKIWSLDKGPEGAGVFGSERYNRVLEAFQEKAEEGDTFAQYAVGCLYYQWGRLYESANPDAYQKKISWYQQSYEWFEQAANNGHAGALYSVAWQAYSELGCAQDREYAGQRWLDAAVKGHKEAFRQLFELVEEFRQESEEDEDDEYAWEQADRAGDWLNDLLSDGPEETASWFRELAEQGNDAALKFLKQKALDWSGHVGALRCLVEMADAGHEGAREALQKVVDQEWDEFDAPMGYLREATQAGSEWGRKTYDAVLALLREKAEAGENWAQEILAELLRAAEAK